MTVFLIVICFIAALLIFSILLQPSGFVVTRSAVIDAAPQAVFAKINNFRNWESWSPWAKLDPNAQTRYDGPAAGRGAVFEWSGNKTVGAGRMMIVDSQPNARVDIRLDMREPFAASNDVSFILTPEGREAEASAGWLTRALGFGKSTSRAKTLVTWSMSGNAGFVGKAMNLLMNCDKMVGGQFEKGLANLNALFHK